MAPATKRGDERCQMAIRFLQRYAVIPIASVSHRLPGVVWNMSCKVKWGLSVVILPLAMLIQG